MIGTGMVGGGGGIDKLDCLLPRNYGYTLFNRDSPRELGGGKTT